MTSFHDEPLRLRALSPEIEARREAITAMRPINQRIGGWQAALARMTLMAQRNRAGLPRGLAAEANALIEAVEQQRRDLAGMRVTLPAAVAGNGRIDDTDHALARLAESLKRTAGIIRSSSTAP